MVGTIVFGAANIFLRIKNIDDVSHNALLSHVIPWEKSSPLRKSVQIGVLV